MKHAATILAAIITLAAIANAAPPNRFTARWGGPVVEWLEPATGHRWTCTYEEFFKYCGKRHPREMGIKVLGSLPPATQRQAPAIAPAPPRPQAPQIIAKATPKRSVQPSAAPAMPTANFEQASAEHAAFLLPPVLPQSVTLAEAFRSMATGTAPPPEWMKDTPEPEPAPQIIAESKTQELEPVNITDGYDVRRRAIITAGRLDDILGGKLAGTGSTFIAEARKNGICPVFLAGVAIHESANGTSRIVRERNNAFGICPGGSYARYDSIAENIAAAARLLGGKSYAGGSRYTIGEIQKRYCPIGENDPRGLNHHWRSGVVHHMKTFLGGTVHVASL